MVCGEAGRGWRQATLSIKGGRILSQILKAFFGTSDCNHRCRVMVHNSTNIGSGLCMARTKRMRRSKAVSGRGGSDGGSSGRSGSSGWTL